jgi:hypothetical protein
MTAHRTFQLLLGVAALGAAIPAFHSAPSKSPAAAALPPGSCSAAHDEATLPAVYVDAAPIVITARGARAATPTVHLEAAPILVRGRKPPPVKPAARIAQQPCESAAEGC